MADDGGDVEADLTAALQPADDVDMIGYGHRHAAAARVEAMAHDALPDGEYRRSRTDPAHHRLVPYAHRHDVVARQVAVLTPVQRRTVVGKVADRKSTRLNSSH